MFGKLTDQAFLADVAPLLPADEAEEFDSQAERAALITVFTKFVKRIPGHIWAETPAMAEKRWFPEKRRKTERKRVLLERGGRQLGGHDERAYRDPRVNEA